MLSATVSRTLLNKSTHTQTHRCTHRTLKTDGFRGTKCALNANTKLNENDSKWFSYHFYWYWRFFSLFILPLKLNQLISRRRYESQNSLLSVSVQAVASSSSWSSSMRTICVALSWFSVYNALLQNFNCRNSLSHTRMTNSNYYRWLDWQKPKIQITVRRKLLFFSPKKYLKKSIKTFNLFFTFGIEKLDEFSRKYYKCFRFAPTLWSKIENRRSAGFQLKNVHTLH